MTDFLSAFVFYLFAAVLVLSSTMVVSARNPVHAVLFLILAFFNAAGLFLLMGAEFVAMILVIVYVGAVAVLFLFVVMMLDIDFMRLRQGFKKQLPVGVLLGGVLLGEVVVMAVHWTTRSDVGPFLAAPINNGFFAPSTNTHALGQLLYTQYLYLFQAAGLVLLVAMIGAIVLTLRHQPNVRRQNPGHQAARERGEVLAVKSVKTGEGISL